MLFSPFCVPKKLVHPKTEQSTRSGQAQQQGRLPSDWRFTIQSIAMERRAIKIDENQYKFGRELGSGAFGCVYSARNAADNKPVAIKVVSLASMSSGEAEMLAESILTEIEMSKRLSRASRHFVHMYDFDFHRQSGLAFLVMELGQQDLDKYLNERPRLTSEERKQIWRQLVNIAVALDTHQIVHLDIKPANLIVFPDNKVKLADLGIAQRAYQQKIGSSGTWLYSAPEVTNVTRHQITMHTSKADVWSWGAVLYRMTYLEPPDYKPPCHHPPRNQHSSRDPNLVDVVRHTLVLDPRQRVDII